MVSKDGPPLQPLPLEHTKFEVSPAGIMETLRGRLDTSYLELWRILN